MERSGKIKRFKIRRSKAGYIEQEERRKNIMEQLSINNEEVPKKRPF